MDGLCLSSGLPLKDAKLLMLPCWSCLTLGGINHC